MPVAHLFPARPVAFIHLAVFFVSVALVYMYRGNTFLSMILSEAIILYIALVNYRNREILPALSIILVFKLIEYPISLASFNSAQWYLVTLIAFDAALIYALLRFYRAEALWRLFRVNMPRLPIPQVKGIAALLGIGLVHSVLVLSEVLLHFSGMVQFESAPFFYRTFPEARATLKVVLMLGVWSMMLDAHYHPFRKKEPA